MVRTTMPAGGARTPRAAKVPGVEVRTPSSPSLLAVVSIIGLSAAAFLGPLLAHGPLPEGSDVYATNHYLIEFSKAFSEGDAWPRWTGSTNQGLGAPSFVMFPPFFYYVAGAFSAAAGSFIGGSKLALILLTILAGISFYALAREWVGPGIAAACGAGLYLVLPYHVLDLYQRWAMSETSAFIFFPLILLFCRRVMDGGTRLDLAGLILSYAGLIYTHIVSALLFSFLLAPWLLWESWGRWRSLAGPVLGLALGLCLAAPYLLPAVVEKSDANISWNREMPNGDFRINFIFRDDPLPGLGFKDPVKPPVLKSAHSQLILALVSAWAVVMLLPSGDVRRRRQALGLAAGCSFAYLLQLQISTPIWVVVPELASIQFPWRFQTVMVLTSSLLAAAALWAASDRARKGSKEWRPWLLALVMASVAVNLAFAWSTAFLKPYTFGEDQISHPFVTGWSEPAFTPIQFKAYRNFKQARVDLRRAEFASGSGDIQVATWESSHRRLEIDSPSGGRVRLGTFWFPGWKGLLDGAPLEIEPDDPYATIGFDVPAGKHEVDLRFASTPVRRAAAWIGILAVPATLLASWAFPRLRSLAAA